MKVEAGNRAHGLTLRINHGKEERVLVAPQSVYQCPNVWLPLFLGCFCGPPHLKAEWILEHNPWIVMLADGRWKMIWLEVERKAGGGSHSSGLGTSIQISIGCEYQPYPHCSLF